MGTPGDDMAQRALDSGETNGVLPLPDPGGILIGVLWSSASLIGTCGGDVWVRGRLRNRHAAGTVRDTDIYVRPRASQ